MKKTLTRTRRRHVALLAALCLCASVPARPARKFEPAPARPDAAARLRVALSAALGGDFELARERLARRSAWHGGGLYWLAHLRARRGGEFHVAYKYRYEDRANPQDPLYAFVERRTLVRVGERGCARQPRHDFVCVGDTVILPVVVNDYTGHAFSVTRRPFTPGDASAAGLLRDAEDASLNREPVPNPAGRFLRYVGRRAHYSPHRAPGYTVTYEATFEAVAPGAFNLAVGVSAPGAGPPDPSRLSAGGSVPVVVVARGAPVTVLSSREEVHGYTERFSSRSGESYPTTPVVLQTGERLTLRYGGFSVRGRPAPGEHRGSLGASAKDRPPSISLLPFGVDPGRGFNEWVVDFLPPPARVR